MRRFGAMIFYRLTFSATAPKSFKRLCRVVSIQSFMKRGFVMNTAIQEFEVAVKRAVAYCGKNREAIPDRLYFVCGFIEMGAPAQSEDFKVLLESLDLLLSGETK